MSWYGGHAPCAAAGAFRVQGARGKMIVTLLRESKADRNTQGGGEQGLNTLGAAKEVQIA